MYGNANSGYQNNYQQNQQNQQNKGNKKEDKVYEPYNFAPSLGLPVNEFSVGSSGLDNNIPESAVADMRRIAFALKDKGYVFRDRITENHPLEQACRESGAVCDAYVINDKHANGNYREIILPDDIAYKAACYIYVNSRKDNTPEKFNDLKSISKRFKARDVQCLYGKDLASPVKFVFIYSQCGSTKFTKDTNYSELDMGASEILFSNKVVPLNIINLGNKQSIENFFKELALL